MLAAVADGCVRCWTRHGADLTGAVGDIVGELHELVFGRDDHALTFVVFGAPRLAGEELTGRPWYERRAALEQILTPAAAASSSPRPSRPMKQCIANC
jgi:ATP-dependent DNA ligase